MRITLLPLACLFFGLDAAAQSLPASSVCGDGVQSRGELCDDGNTVSGDGCTFDCMGLEACGDRRVDTKESCDDGNVNPGDGCDATCNKEMYLKLPEKAQRRAAIGTAISYPALLLVSAQFRGTDASGAISLLAITTGIAPSFGHFYTKAYGRGAATTVVRYLLNAGASVSIAFFSALNEIEPLNAQSVAGAVTLTTMFLLPSIGFSLWDIKDAPLSIERMARRGKYR
jgi:cysteine-rich repeat protein